jgi:hypothetical protein
VVCLAANPTPIYRPRRPRHSPLYQTIERYLPEFERTYHRSYAKQYGPWRPIIGDVARRFLRCGDLHFGFARVRCPDCRHEMFVAFSCGSALPLSKLPSEAHPADRRDDRPDHLRSGWRIGNLSSRSPSGFEFTAATIGGCSAN